MKISMFSFCLGCEKNTAVVFNPEDRGSMYLRNVGIYVQDHTTLVPRRLIIDNLLRKFRKTYLSLIYMYYNNKCPGTSEVSSRILLHKIISDFIIDLTKCFLFD